MVNFQTKIHLNVYLNQVLNVKKKIGIKPVKEKSGAATSDRGGGPNCVKLYKEHYTRLVIMEN